ncbi:WW domain-containing oxidoreductase-like isoform X3 [Dysidea avara]
MEQQVSLVDPRLLTSRKLKKSSVVDKYAGIQHRFQPHTKAIEIVRNVNLKGKTALITGANSGLGFETARVLALTGAHVFMACRNMTKAQQAMQRILAEDPSAYVEVLHLDLASLHSVKQCVQQFTAKNVPLHILVCNAASFGGPFQLSSDGLELHFATNHLGHFYLTQLLKEALIKSAPARVIVVSSESHRYTDLDAASLNLCTLQKPNKDDYHTITAYGTSKLCNMLFALELNRIMIQVGVTCNVVHPGNLLSTNMLRNAGMLYNLLRMMMWPFVKSVEQAAAGIVFCAAHPTMDEIGGLYLYDCWPVHPSEEAQNADTATALWELSEQLIRERTTPNT